MMNCLRMFEAPRNLMIAVLGVFVFLAASPAARSQTTDSPDAATTIKRQCSTCHSADAAGTALGTRLHAPDLRSKEVQDKTNTALAQVISAGKNNMPSFKNRLDDQQIQKLVEYIRTFHADAAAPK